MRTKPRRYGMLAATYEINDDPVYQDMLNPLGFSFALSLCLRLYKQVPKKLVVTSNLSSGHVENCLDKPCQLTHLTPAVLVNHIYLIAKLNAILRNMQAGLGWFAPVCSSWVWINRLLNSIL